MPDQINFSVVALTDGKPVIKRGLTVDIRPGEDTQVAALRLSDVFHQTVLLLLKGEGDE